MRFACAVGMGRSCARRGAWGAGLLVLLGTWQPLSATTVYYSTNQAGEVRRTDGQGSTLLLSGLSTPRDLAFGPDGLLYVAEEGGSRITRLDPVAKRRVGAAFATAYRHTGLGFGPDGMLYTAAARSDYNLGLVERFDAATGAPAGGPSAPASDRAQFTAPVNGVYFEGMEMGPDGNVYCAGWRTSSVEVYQGPNGASPGAYVGRLVGGLSKPINVTFGPDGRPYVLEYVNNTVMRYDPAARTFRTFASGSFLSNPVGFDFGPDGSLYVSNSGANNIVRIDGPGGAHPGALLGVFATTPSRPVDILVVPEPAGPALLLVAAAGGLSARRGRPRKSAA